MACSEHLEPLEAALEDPELLDMLTPVTAITFGVIPIEKRDDKLVVACGETWLPACRPFVEAAVGMPIETVQFRDGVIRHYALKAYLSDYAVNHNTFADPDFLDRFENAPLLMLDKVEQVGQVGSELPPDKLVLLDVTYASELQNLDARPLRGEFLCGRADLPFRIEGDQAVVYGADLDDDVFLILRSNCFCDAAENSGDDSYHAIHCVHLNYLPYMIHPSEIQITQVGVDGSVTFYVYDRLETLRPGQTANWPIRYYFLSLGNRHSRYLTLQVHTLALVDREQVALTTKPIEWTDEDLRRWFRLDERGRL